MCFHRFVSVTCTKHVLAVGLSLSVVLKLWALMLLLDLNPFPFIYSNYFIALKTLLLLCTPSLQIDLQL